MQGFVFGATGYTGQAVVRELSARHHAVAAHIRPESKQRERLALRFADLRARVEIVPWEPEALSQAIRRVRPDWVFSLLGTTTHRARQEGVTGNIYQAVEGRLTAMLLDVVKATVPEARFVFLSSLGTNQHTNNAYLRARSELEQRIRDSGVAYTIARPSFITGPDRDEFRFFERTVATLSDAALGIGRLLGAKNLARRYASFTSDELAKALVHAAASEQYRNRVLESEELRTLSRGE